MEKKFDLLTLGEILLRLSPPNCERIVSSDVFEKHVGGAELNVASGVSLLGLNTGFISKVPDNSLGDYVRAKVRSYGVSDAHIISDSKKDARLGLYVYESGAYPRKPGIVYDRRNSSIYSMDIHDIPEAVYSQTRCFHTSGITLALSEKVRETAIEMIRRFKDGGALISFDVNFRGNLWSGAEAKKYIEQILPYVDIFFCSEDTARLTFLKEGDVKQIMRSFASEYPMSVIASTQRIVHSPKVHTFGSIVYDVKNDIFYEDEPYRNIEVVDRIGSGDAYVSGALYGILAHGLSCEKAMDYGNAAGALKNTVPGDLPCSGLKEMDKIISEHHSEGIVLEMDR